MLQNFKYVVRMLKSGFKEEIMIYLVELNLIEEKFMMLRLYGQD
jgi:hypothetical protein